MDGRRNIRVSFVVVASFCITVITGMERCAYPKRALVFTAPASGVVATIVSISRCYVGPMMGYVERTILIEGVMVVVDIIVSS